MPGRRLTARSNFDLVFELDVSRETFIDKKTDAGSLEEVGSTAKD